MPVSDEKLCVEKNERPSNDTAPCHHTPTDEVYSVFTKCQATTIVTLVSIAGFFSPFTAFVYFPALRSIASDFDVSLELINLTVTAYLIVQGIVPTLLGDISENIGRRPVYLFIFALYTLSSLGLALQRHYAALLILRMLQSAGSSGAIALAYGVIGDIAAPHERGAYVGKSHIGFNTAPALGPVIGGLIAERAGWPWIFGFLSAFSGLLLVFLVLFLHETSRSLVGNGSLMPSGINKTLYQHLRRQNSDKKASQPRFRIPNIMPSLSLIFHKNTSLLLLSNAVFYMMYSVLQATAAPQLEHIYGLTPLQAGLCYLAYGIAGGIASYTLGLVTDRDYRIVAKQHNLGVDKRRGDDLLYFPIERARLRSLAIYVPICSTAVIGYGWALSAQKSLALVIILQFVIGFTTTGIFNVCNTLVVDTYPTRPVIASASVSITRCLVAAGGVAVIELLLNTVGPGWSFTVVGGLCWMTSPLLLIVRAKGWQWRTERHEKDLVSRGS